MALCTFLKCFIDSVILPNEYRQDHFKKFGQCITHSIKYNIVGYIYQSIRKIMCLLVVKCEGPPFKSMQMEDLQGKRY